MTEETEPINMKRAGSIAGAAFLILLGVVFLAYLYSRPRGGAIVLPGGVTYLGPSPTAKAQSSNVKTQNEQQRFTAETDEVWTTVKSTKYGYTFSVPETLTIEPFLTEEFDAYAINWNNVAPEANVLIGIENLSNDEKKAVFVQKSKKEYIESYWAKQYNLTGIKTLELFTNTKGLKGYKVKFQTADGVSPFDDVFFEVPKRPNLVIHLSNAILDPAVFEKIVESVEWTSG